MSPRLLLVCAIAISACKGKATPAAKPTTVPVAIFIDDRQVATTATLSTAPRALVELAPGVSGPETWLAVIVIDADGKATTVMAPAREHADALPALAVDASGKVAFAMSKAGAMTAPVAPVAKVIIKTKDDRGAIVAELAAKEGGHGGGDGEGNGHDGDGARPVPSADLAIAITTAKGTQTFTGDKLPGLPSITAPVGDMTTPGWNLLDVLAAAGVTDAKAVNIIDGEGVSLHLEGADLDRAATVLYIKLNRGGQLRFRRYAKQGAAWQMTGELRGLAKIIVP